MNDQKPDDDKVVLFTLPQAAAPGPLAVIETVEDPVAAPDSGLKPWDVAAQSMAAEAYRTAHGMTPTEDLGQDCHKARMGQIQRMLAKELESGMTAVLAWAGISLYHQRVREALRHVILRAEVHAPSKGRHNERVLVFSDRLTVLSDLMEQTPQDHTGAVAWWQEREERLAMLEELPRIIAMVEREFGEPPPAAAECNAVEKIEGIITGLLSLVAQQKQQCGRLELALKQKVKR